MPKSSIPIVEELPVSLTCPDRSRMEISSEAIIQSSLVTRVTAAPERLEKMSKEIREGPRRTREVSNPFQTSLPCSTSAPHAVDILFNVSREIVVKDVCYIEDIQPSGSQICGDKDPDFAWKRITLLDLQSLSGKLTAKKHRFKRVPSA